MMRSENIFIIIELRKIFSSLHEPHCMVTGGREEKSTYGSAFEARKILKLHHDLIFCEPRIL
jgi:hypothetical protein